jgi:pyruvate formate lyase activating enzyme
MIKWIASELGKDVPLHLSRYFPQHKLNLPPTQSEKLELLYELAKHHLNYVYLGNVNDEKRSSTYCPGCGETLISRNRYQTLIQNLNKKGYCTNCKTAVNIML